MRILLTNDDGYDAPGLAALERACAGLGELFVVAPSEQQSNMGHRVTGATGIEVTECGERRWHVGGTPADCARLALTHLIGPVDWVLSGINRGGNLGADIYMSGTVAAAREATLLGHRAAAFSQYVRRGVPLDWDVAAVRVRRVIEVLFTRELPPAVFWNVNLPHLDPGSPEPEPVDCPVDFAPFQVSYRREGSTYYYAGDYHGRPRRPGSDVDQCFNGRIAVTAIPLELR
ncbi:MAG: 5'/3'-nucleotidase SurE [Bryobacteraceae bacterium]|nr:5'/3'-nucleotidase SurE [Bryobacteraceae bacterium]